MDETGTTLTALILSALITLTISFVALAGLPG
jgi:hypothetical protein